MDCPCWCGVPATANQAAVIFHFSTLYNVLITEITCEFQRWQVDKAYRIRSSSLCSDTPLVLPVSCVTASCDWLMVTNRCSSMCTALSCAVSSRVPYFATKRKNPCRWGRRLCGEDVSVIASYLWRAGTSKEDNLQKRSLLLQSPVISLVAYDDPLLLMIIL